MSNNGDCDHIKADLFNKAGGKESNFKNREKKLCVMCS